MGIVARQSIITSIISYSGIVVGYLNLVYLYPKFLELNQVGLLRTIQDAAILLVPVASLGLPQIISRYHPRYSSSAEKYSKFLGLLLVTAAVGYLLVVLFFSLSESFLISTFKDKAPEVVKYTGLVLLMVLLLTYFGVFEQIARSQVKVSIPAFLREVILRIFQAGILGLYVIDLINFDQFLLLSVLLYAGLLLFLVFHLDIPNSKPKLPFKNLTNSELKEILTFGLISLLGVGSSMIISKIDSLMVSGMIGLEAAAIYTTTFYMATVIEVPKRAMTQSATAILSISFEKGDLKNCARVYGQTSRNQLIIGGLLLLGLWANTDNIFSIMPKGDLYSAGALVILFVGLTRLVDMSFGPSSEIIGLSKYYWFNLLVISLLAIISILLNLYLIPEFGITGAAAGTLLSILIYNLAKFFFIFYTMKIQPFSIHSLKTIIAILLTIGINLLIPNAENVWVDILVRSLSITIFYSTLIIVLDCSPEINNQFKKTLEFLRFRSK